MHKLRKKRENPALAARGSQNSSQADGLNTPEDKALAALAQAIGRLQSRFGLPLPTARVVAFHAGFGGRCAR